MLMYLFYNMFSTCICGQVVVCRPCLCFR